MQIEGSIIQILLTIWCFAIFACLWKNTGY